MLATPPPHGTLLAMHHPPLPLPMLRAAELIELHEQDRLAAVVEGTDVRGILAGHLHFSTWSTFAGVPVSVASASCYTSDPAPVAASSPGSTAASRSRWSTCTTTAWCTRSCPSSAGPEVNGLGTRHP